MGISNPTLRIWVIGSSTNIVQIAQQLVFITSAFRLPSPYLALSDCVFEPKGPKQFRLGLAPSEEPSSESNMCWHPPFIGSVIVRGFPVPSRADEVGIELPVSGMLSLARILYPTEYEGGILLKGFDTMLVPTALTEDSVQWHFIQDESSQRSLTSLIRGDLGCDERPKRLPNWAIKDHVRSWIRIESLDDILSKRMFLGFSDKVNVYLETEAMNLGSISYSYNSARTGRDFEVSGGVASLAFASYNLPGPTFAVNFGFSRYQATVKNFINVSFVELLHLLKSMPIILYDDDRNVRKAWLVSALSTILHMAHT